MKNVIGCIALFLAVQVPPVNDGDEIRGLIERLHADRIEERQGAEERLQAIGPAARAALRKSSQNAEGEFSVRVGRLLGMIEVSERLTLNLARTVPDLEHRLAGKDDHEWTLCLLDLVEKDRSGEHGYPGLGASDFNALAGTAARGARSEEERRALCDIVGFYKLSSALGQVREWLAKDKTRYPALEALGRLGDTGSLPAILRLLREGDDSVREAAMRALGEMGAVEAAPEIVPMLRHRKTQEKAISALGQLKARSTVPLILPLLEVEDDDTRIGALGALAELGAREAVAKMRPLLTAQGTRVRARAASALGELDPPEGVELLSGMLEDPEWEVRHAVAFALREMSHPSRASALTRPMKDTNPKVRRESLYAMRDLSSRDRVPEVLEGLADPDREVREAAAVVLGRWGVGSAVTPLRKVAKDPEKAVRQAAVTALGRIGAKEAVPEVLDLLKDRDDFVREAAAEAAGLLEAEEARPLIMQVFRNDRWARPEAASALGRLRARESIPDIVTWCLRETPNRLDAERAMEAMQEWSGVIGAVSEYLRDKDPSIRREAVAWLTRLRARESANEIARVLGDPDINVRSAAIRAVADLEAKDTVPKVLPLLEDPSRRIRREALTALGILGEREALRTIRSRVPVEHHSLRWDLALARLRLGDREPLPEFASYLNHREAIVREETVGWIGNLRAKETLAAVRRATGDLEASVRKESLRALCRIDPEGAMQSLVEALKDPDKNIGWEAISLLGELEVWSQAEQVRPLIQVPALRVKAAEWLCEAGSWEGVDLLFPHHSHLKYLNALRAPEGWKRLKRTRVSRADLKGSLKDVLTTLCERAGLGFDSLEKPSVSERRHMNLERRSWSSWNRHEFGGSSESSLMWLTTILFQEDYAFIVQDNRLSLMREDDVEAAWAAWVKDNRPGRR